MAEITFEDRVKGLRGWARGQDAHIRAAVELLIWNESWLRRADFVDKCVVQLSAGLVASIDWYEAESFADAAPRSSSSQRRVLSAAIMLAEQDESWLRFRADAHAQAVVTAIAAAMEVDIVKPTPPRLAEPERWLADDARAVLARWTKFHGTAAVGATASDTEGVLAGKLRDVLAILDRVVPQGGDGA